MAASQAPGLETTYAQTNLQLFNQLQQEDYSNADLKLVHTAYALAMRLYGGYFIGSVRTQIAHVVGTASILGSLHASTAVVAAGLIHNVYQNGDFGDGQRRGSNARREQIRQALGEEVETYVYRFPSLRLASPTISHHSSSFEMLDQIDCNVLLIILAERLEHRLNLEYLTQNDQPKVEIAEKLGFPALAAGLRRPLAEDLGRFANPTGQKRGYVIAPRSYRQRFWLMFREEFIRGFSRLRSATRVRTRFRRLMRRINATP